MPHPAVGGQSAITHKNPQRRELRSTSPSAQTQRLQPVILVILMLLGAQEEEAGQEGTRISVATYALSSKWLKGDALQAVLRLEKEKCDRYLRNAFRNCLHIPEISLKALVAKKRAGKARYWPKKLQRTTISWPSAEPHLAVDKEGLPLAVHIPNFMGPVGRRRLYRALRTFSREVGVKIRRGADAGKRDSVKGYPYRHKENYISGIFQLVGAWTAIGHPPWQDDDAVPAGDVMKNGRIFRTAMNLLRELSFTSSIIDHILSNLDPAAYGVLHEARTRLVEQNAAYAAVASLDPTYLHGRSISYNRATRNHEDTRDPPEAWTPILVVGKFKRGGTLVIKKLGMRITLVIECPKYANVGQSNCAEQPLDHKGPAYAPPLGNDGRRNTRTAAWLEEDLSPEVQQKRRAYVKEIKVTRAEVRRAVESPKAGGYGVYGWKPKAALTYDMQHDIERTLLAAGLASMPSNFTHMTTPMTAEQVETAVHAYLIEEKKREKGKAQVISDPKLWQIHLLKRKAMLQEEDDQALAVRKDEYRQRLPARADPARPEIEKEMRANQHLRRFYHVFEEEGLIAIANVP
ncbi:hypothetical protein AURDEDRAFT_132027, partial [Auricularia subglabra TFB-10046 SS5]